MPRCHHDYGADFSIVRLFHILPDRNLKRSKWKKYKLCKCHPQLQVAHWTDPTFANLQPKGLPFLLALNEAKQDFEEGNPKLFLFLSHKNTFCWKQNYFIIAKLLWLEYFNKNHQSPRNHCLGARAVACEARGPRFDSSSDQMVFLLSLGR